MYRLFATCPRGLEPYVGRELRALGARSVRPLRAGVSFAGDLRTAYRACLWLRTASRVLLHVADVPSTTSDMLYEAIRELPWEDHLAVDGTLAVDVTGHSTGIRNTVFGAQRVKDAIVDRFRDSVGSRPGVDLSAPDVRINVRIGEKCANVAIDISGDALHKRGYREPKVQVQAPLKESLAAGVLFAAGWPEIAMEGGSFADPLCGSATLAIEAAWIAADVAPGLLRPRWGFSAWGGHDASVWDAVVTEAAERRVAGLAVQRSIVASDFDPRAVAIASECVRRAGLEGVVSVEKHPLVAARPADGTTPGLFATNPPYGQRMSSVAGGRHIAEELAATVSRWYGAWTCGIFTSDADFPSRFGATPERRVELYNGPTPATVFVFPPSRGAVCRANRPEDAGASPTEDCTRVPPDEAARAFTNRLTKMAKHHGQWARRSGISCYRVYDADLPDYAVAIDVYNGAGPDEGRRWVHVAEYAAPSEIDPDKARARLEEVIAAVPQVLDVDARDVFLKVRQRQRGAAQYSAVSRTGVTGIVAEDGLLFEVNLSDYLDTGLFLDHRMTRKLLRDMARGTRFLNLFAYTGAASVHAAAGGAVSTTTIDLSATYLAWAERNMLRNGFMGGAHERIRADVGEWLASQAKTRERYGLIFLDPPTFSNSKRMEGTLDVQRDHVELIVSASRLLEAGGTVVFSCNRRGFRMDVAELGNHGLRAKDVTAQTIPRDFERRSGAHVTWLIEPTEESE